MACKNRIGEIMTIPNAAATQVTLTIRLRHIHPPLRHSPRLAMRATRPPANAASEPSQSTSHHQSAAKEQVPSLAPRSKSSRRFTPFPAVCHPDDLTPFHRLEQTSLKHRMSSQVNRRECWTVHCGKGGAFCTSETGVTMGPWNLRNAQVREHALSIGRSEVFDHSALQTRTY